MKARPAGAVRVLLVWEPVLATDWGTPNASLTSIAGDRRVVQFWDRGRMLSALMGGREKLETLARVEKVGFGMRGVIWDAAFVYPPGAMWGSPADALFAPVVKFREELEGALFVADRVHSR